MSTRHIFIFDLSRTFMLFLIILYQPKIQKYIYTYTYKFDDWCMVYDKTWHHSHADLLPIHPTRLSTPTYPLFPHCFLSLYFLILSFFSLSSFPFLVSIHITSYLYLPPSLPVSSLLTLCIYVLSLSLFLALSLFP